MALWFAIHKYEDGETILSDETVKVWVLRTMLSDFADINIDDDPFPIAHGQLASELGISSQPWLSKAYLSPLMAQGYIAQTLPKKPKSPLQRYRLLRKGKDVLA